MRLKVVSTSLDIAKKNFAIMSRYDAELLGVFPLEMVVINANGKEYASFVEIGVVGKGEVIISTELAKLLGIGRGSWVEVRKREELKSKEYIRKKIEGKRLNRDEIYEIIRDVVKRNLNDLELAAFVTSLHIHGLSDTEAMNISMAMVETGKTLGLKRKVIADKHSIGGVPGDKTSLLVIPIVSSLGITIPKTSSRAITSPAGTADREEVIMRNDLTIEEMREVVKKTNGCLVWGGSLEMSPADDIFITIEKPLNLDPLFIPSILSKKKAVGATHLVLDIPTGREAKIESLEKAKEIASRFKRIGKRMGIKIKAISTYADQPLGRYVGPALEAYEALQNLIEPKQEDLVEKAVSVAGLLISMVKEIPFREGKKLAMKQLESGKAYRQLVRIARAQGARATRPEEIEFGKYHEDVFSEEEGYVEKISNKKVVNLSRILGSPAMKGSGILLHKKIGDYVEEGERIMTLYSENRERLEEALGNAGGVLGIGKRRPGKGKMVLGIF